MRPPIRVLDLAGSAAEMGRVHGTTHAAEIRHHTTQRLDLVCAGEWSGGPVGRDVVLELAESCVEHHRSFSPTLYEEMAAMASAAGISAAEAIVVGGFTDFVDTVRGALGGSHPATVVEDDCTAVIVPDQLADGAGVFGQTWDMHDSATDHVVLLRIRPDGAPAALVFTTTGCVGQIGMNEAGVCVGINNLTAADGRAGVTWPVVVREMLTRSSAGEALEVLRSAELAGAHNYLIFDSDGTGYDVEAMPSTRSELELADWPLVHTNHVLSPEAAAVEGDRPPALVAGSRERLARAERLLKDRATAIGVDDVMALTRDPRSICQTSTEPYRIESSGAAVMRPRTGDFWACWGPPAHNDYEHFTLATVT